jgi:hypothetical protein
MNHPVAKNETSVDAGNLSFINTCRSPSKLNADREKQSTLYEWTIYTQVRTQIYVILYIKIQVTELTVEILISFFLHFQL